MPVYSLLYLLVYCVIAIVPIIILLTLYLLSHYTYHIRCDIIAIIPTIAGILRILIIIIMAATV